MTEGGARNLLPFYALPEDVRKNWEDGDQLYSQLRRESFVVQALKGEIGAEEIAQRMEAVKERRSSNLSAAWWKYTDELKSDQVRSVTCAGCELRHENICLDPACYTEKAQIYQRNYLYLASHAADIKPLEDDRHGYGEHTRLMDGYAYHQDSEERAAKAIIAGGCENLRLVFDDRNDLKQDAVHPYSDYPRAKMVCRNHSGTCRCMSGYEAVKSDAAPAVDLSAEELKKAAADKMRERREQTKLAAQLAELAGELMGDAAATLNEKALIVLITMTGTYSAQPDWEKGFEQIVHEKAMNFFRQNMEYQTLEGALGSINRILEICGLPKLSPEDAGKTAAEMLDQAALKIHEDIPVF